MRLPALLALFTIAVAKDLNPIDDLRDHFYLVERDLWKNISDPEWTDTGLGADVELTKAFVAFNKQIEKAPKANRPPFTFWLWNKAKEHLQVIDGVYDRKFMEFVKRQAMPGVVPAPVHEWLDLAESILLDPKSSVAQSVRGFHGLMEHGDLFRNALQAQDSDVCELQMSPHQLIYDMYNTIALTEIKGYAMMQFSWMLLRIYGKGNYTQEASLTRQRYKDRTGLTAAAAREVLSLASRDLYRCDPPVHEAGVSYAEVTRLLQGYIENEVDMNDDRSCRENCGYYTLAKSHGCYDDRFCVKQKAKSCAGRLIGCQYIDSDMWVCPASPKSNRRYEWIEYENGRTLGKVGQCSRGTTKVDSWWKWYLLHCSYCMCLCEDAPSNSERFFSMREAVSDIYKSKVVTGLRLTKIGKVFHLQIAHSTLGERGSVSAGEWVPIQKFDPADFGVNEGTDYHTLTYERRAIDLDELDSPVGYVLTGVRFKLVGAHLHFEIRSTPFNYTTGSLSPEKSQWISNDNTEGAIESPRKRLDLFKPDIPTRGNSPLPVDSQHDQYIEFTHTDFDADAAQSTVPFVDIQPLLPNKGSTLSSGAGLIHRGARGSGGFIAVKLLTYNFSKHIKAEPPPSDMNEDSTEFAPSVV